MRKPKEHVADDGTRTFRVRFRQGGTETSKTFRLKDDAKTFAALLDSGVNGVTEALSWLALKEEQGQADTFAQWFDSYVDQLTGVTARTRADYHSMNRRYLDSIQLLPLPLVTRPHVTRIVNQLEADGLSAKTIKNVIHMLSSAMGLAVDEGHIAKNPCRRVRLPEPGVDVGEPRFLEPDEFSRLYDEIPNHYKPLVLFLVGTGLRWSEATALAPKHVSLSRGTVKVERAWKWQGKGGGWKLGPPKSKKGRRTVNAAVMALAAVGSMLDGEYVFTTPTGKVVRHNNFYARIWIPACERAGLAGTRVHDLRHTHASWLISDGQSLEAVQDQLGHESILTTRKVYGHLQPAIGVAVGKSASESLAAALRNGVQAGDVPLALNAVKSSDEGADADDVAPDGDHRSDAEQNDGGQAERAC